MKSISRVVILIITSLFASLATAETDNAAESKAFIETMMMKSLVVVNNDEFDAIYKRDQLRELVNVYFDFDLISELTLSKFSVTSKKKLGRYSSHRFNEKQQAEFSKLFQTHLTNLYLDRLNDSTRLTVSVNDSASLKPKKDLLRARVKTIINDLTAIDYSLGKHTAKNIVAPQWKIYDVRVEGRSLVASFRKEYNTLLIKNTPEQLLALLREKNGAHQ